jgi:hypothetical protein
MSTTEQPPEKKQKVTDANLWRSKCINRFDLKPLPKGFPSSASSEYSDDSWKRYYDYRVKIEESDPRNSYDGYDSDGNSIGPSELDEDHEDIQDIVYSWTSYGMANRLEKLMVDEVKWQWTPQKPICRWDDPGTPTSVDYYAHVWSPFAIPHAIKLNHEWYGKVGWSYSELVVDYNYKLINFEDSDDVIAAGKFVELCSFNNDVIKTSKLNKTTVSKLRKFLYGASTAKSKAHTCSDKDFLLLLFGSMGSTDEDLMDDTKNCCLGYTWFPWKDEAMKKKLFDLKAPENDDANADPPTTIDKYSPKCFSWLMHAVLAASDSLGPISKHYVPPPKKASRTSSYDSDDYGW